MWKSNAPGYTTISQLLLQDSALDFRAHGLQHTGNKFKVGHLRVDDSQFPIETPNVPQLTSVQTWMLIRAHQPPAWK